MTKFNWILYEYNFLRARGYGRVRAGIKAVVETFAPLPF